MPTTVMHITATPMIFQVEEELELDESLVLEVAAGDTPDDVGVELELIRVGVELVVGNVIVDVGIIVGVGVIIDVGVIEDIGICGVVCGEGEALIVLSGFEMYTSGLGTLVPVLVLGSVVEREVLWGFETDSVVPSPNSRNGSCRFMRCASDRWGVTATTKKNVWIQPICFMSARYEGRCWISHRKFNHS